LQQEAKFLCRTWEAINYRLKHHSNEPLVHENPSLMMRTIRDLSINDVERIRIDSLSDYQKVLSFTQKFIPELEERIEHYNKDRPIFDLYSIEDEIQRALERKVVLKSGGYLVVDQTEAMSTIDVNTGAFVGHRNLEETIFKTNLEAAHSIARQLRLRNLGGIIILDFIDMSSERHRSEVMRNLERELEKDHARTCIFPVSELGLVEMTRKRIRESLEHVLCESCPTCSGRGSLKTDETICYDIFREIMRESRQYDDAQQFLVLAHQDVIDRMLDEESHSVAELETCIEKPIRFQSEPLYTREQFDVVLM
jgi:ribonuclease G